MNLGMRNEQSTFRFRTHGCHAYVPDHTKDNGRQQVKAPLWFTIRGEGDNKRKHGCKQVGRRGKQERIDFRHAECRNDGRDELRNSSCGGLGDDDQCEKVQFVIGRGGSERLEEGHGFFVSDSGIFFESVNGNRFFPQGEPAGAIERIRGIRPGTRSKAKGLRRRVIGQNEH